MSLTIFLRTMRTNVTTVSIVFKEKRLYGDRIRTFFRKCKFVNTSK